MKKKMKTRDEEILLMKTNLANIKSHSAVDKDLKIIELEKENAYLLIQLNKYKGQIAKLKPVKNLNPKQKKDIYKKKLDAFQAHYQTQVKAKERYRDLVKKHAAREDFLRVRIVKKFGLEVFMEMLNHVDNPDRASKFDTIEKQETMRRVHAEKSVKYKD